MSSRTVTLFLSGALAVFVATPVTATDLNVAMNGVDSSSCGDRKAPCRTIGQAVALANAGDTIIVGPGQYSDDVNENGVTGEPGEEQPQPCLTSSFPPTCMVKVDKPVTIESRDGAQATQLMQKGFFAADYLIGIEVSGVTIGRPGKGFSFTTNPNFGAYAAISFASLQDITIAGNVFELHARGIYEFDDFPGGTGITIRDNFFRTSEPTMGMSRFAAGYQILGNTFELCMFGLHISGTEHVVEHNRIAPQGDCPVEFLQGGLSVSGGGHQVKENTIIGTAGLSVFGAPGQAASVLSGNTVVGNRFGIEVYGGALITGNNIYGNDAVPGRPEGLTNCGIYNRSSGVLTATNNYWGASTGPGDDPADNICNEAGSTANVEPFATKEFRRKGPRP